MLFIKLYFATEKIIIIYLLFFNFILFLNYWLTHSLILFMQSGTLGLRFQ